MNFVSKLVKKNLKLGFSVYTLRKINRFPSRAFCTTVNNDKIKKDLS